MTDEKRQRSSADGRWARLRVAGDVPLRRGAWYRVLSMDGKTVTVSVNGKAVIAPRDQLELRSTPPRTWTIIRQGKGPQRMPEHLKYGYVVCPSCRTRAQLPAAGTREMRCPRCNVMSDVAWEENYLSQKPKRS